MKAIRLAISVIVFTISFSVRAAEIPWVNQKPITLTVQEWELKALLQTLFANQKIPVQISSELDKYTLSGKFSGSAENIYSNLKNTYALQSFHDGQTLYVTHASEAKIKTIILNSELIQRAKALIEQVALPDSSNTLTIVQNENLIVLKGSPRFIQLSEELIQPLVSAAQDSTLSIKVFPLKYAWAHDVTLNFGGKQVIIPGLATTIRSLIVGDVSSNRANDLVNKTTQEKLRGKGLKAYSSGEKERNTSQQSIIEMTTPISRPDLTDLVRIEADRRLNVIVVRDNPSRMSHYAELIELLDKEPELIEIEAQIIDVKIDQSLGLGINWRANSSAIDLLFSGSASAAAALANALTPSDITGNAIGLTASTLVGDRNRFAARISALESKGAAKIMARPQIMTLGNVEAVLESTSSFYVRVAGNNEVDLFNVASGTTLRVTPRVLHEENQSRIQILVSIEDGNQTSQNVDQIPVIERATLNTQALINEGQSLLIGGMVRDTNSQKTNKVPWLSGLPGVGALFRENQQQTSRVERLFLITPHIVKNNTLTSNAKQISQNIIKNLTNDIPPAVNVLKYDNTTLELKMESSIKVRP